MDLVTNWFFWLFLVFYAAYFLVEIGLDLLNLKYVDKHRKKIPELFEGIYSPEDYQKSIDYTRSKTEFKITCLVIKSIFIFILIFLGAFGAIDLWLLNIFPLPFVRGIVYSLVILAIFYVFALPQSYYFQFVIEERFGFNRMDVKTFITDQIKSV